MTENHKEQPVTGFQMKYSSIPAEDQDEFFWIYSSALAVNDLILVHTVLIEQADADKPLDWYYFRSGLAHLKETWELVNAAMGNNAINRMVLQSPELKELKVSMDRSKKPGGYDFESKIIKPNRNIVNHYPKKKEDREFYKTVIESLVKDDLAFNVYFKTDDQREYWEFADEIFVNGFVTTDMEKYPEIDDLFKDLSAMVVSTLAFLRALVAHYFERFI